MARSSTSFQKGQSGNPSGRSKRDAEVQVLARQYTEEAISGLVALARSAKTPASTRQAAWSSVLDRAWGRPAQTLNASINRRDPSEMTDAELTAIASGGEDDTSAPTNGSKH